MRPFQHWSTGLMLWLVLTGCSGPESELASSSSSSAAPVRNTASSPATIGHIERLDPTLDTLVPTDAVLEILADGLDWAEGPLWIADGDYVLFSDVPANRVYRWRASSGTDVWLEPSGYTGLVERGGEPGSNGLLLDTQGRLILCQHGDRRLARLAVPLANPAPEFITVADRFDGQRFNSPNDAALHSSGAIYFTDPPYGLAEGPDDPNRDLDYSGVFRVDPDGTVDLLTRDLTRPNGIAFSPDESTLYVANSDPDRAIWMAYDVQPDGALAGDRIFFDATAWVPERPGLPDGLKVDRQGYLFAAGPGGVLVFAPDGSHLGTIVTTQATANCAFGDEGASLYITADRYLLRLRLVSPDR